MPALYQREKPTPLTRDDLILERLDDIKEDLRELEDNQREIKRSINRLNARIDKIESEFRDANRHQQLMTVSFTGIALAVIYFVFTH